MAIGNNLGSNSQATGYYVSNDPFQTLTGPHLTEEEPATPIIEPPPDTNSPETPTEPPPDAPAPDTKPGHAPKPCPGPCRF